MKASTKQIDCFELTGQFSGPTVLITAGVHGDEYEPFLTTMRLRNELIPILKHGKVLIVNVVNHSAYDSGSRYGSDGLDLARICPGKNEGTLSEKAAFEISEIIRKSDYFIDMHTGGNLFDIFPLAGYMMHTNEDVLEKQRMMAKAFSLPVIWGTDSAPNGRTLSVARDADVPAIYVEYGGGGFFNKKVVESYSQGCIKVLQALGMVKDTLIFPTGNTSYWVEDASPDSGHLQGKMLSDYDGIFVSTVNNGGLVEKDQEWGFVYDPISNEKHTILADSEGLVLFIRKSPRVKKGDSLGGILSLKNNKINKE